ncbi:MAG: MptD family putative ECF transporter S component [Oscillospiraceae bacterium]|nr:MptD family putative ECF transporter S component [Oscillospiraceae bacterium]
MRNKYLERFKVKEIVFLAIISAVTLCTCAVMPLVVSLQTVVFGIAQAVTGLQIAVFYSIGLMKIRKPGSLFIMSFLSGLFQLMMSPPMFFNNLIIGVALEVFVYLVFHGYKSDKAIFFSVLLFNPLSLPFNLIYNYLFGRQAMVAVASRAPWLTVVMTAVVILISAAGALTGIRISKELKKSGVMKK